MRSLLLLGACLAAASAQTCSDVTAPAPCGQLSDSEERCLFKGCCYNASAAYPCFYPGGDAVPITDVHVVQASHFDAGFAYTISGVLTLWWTVHYPRALRLGLEIEGNASYAGIGLQFMTHVRHSASTDGEANDARRAGLSRKAGTPGTLAQQESWPRLSFHGQISSLILFLSHIHSAGS